jgi:hypothetical protein
LGRHRAGEAFDVAALGAAPSQSANFFKRFQSADRVIDPLPDPFQCFADRSQRFFLELALAGSLRCKEYEKAANVVQLESSLLGTRLRGYNQVANLEKFLPISGRKRRARAQSSPISPGVHTPSPLTGELPFPLEPGSSSAVLIRSITAKCPEFVPPERSLSNGRSDRTRPGRRSARGP